MMDFQRHLIRVVILYIYCTNSASPKQCPLYERKTDMTLRSEFIGGQVLQDRLSNLRIKHHIPHILPVA